MADQDNGQTHEQWLKANSAPGFAALIARHSGGGGMPHLLRGPPCGTHLATPTERHSFAGKVGQRAKLSFALGMRI
jgi:hypothetical protein